jgi:hypothetical protein
MYWGYLILFLLAIFTPVIVSKGVIFLREEQIEGLFIFSYGIIAISMYAVKEKTILRQIREKLSLQREKHDMTKDLSDSYSYIGEANRKIDVLESLVNKFPGTIHLFQLGDRDAVYQSLRDEIRLFAKSDAFAIRIIDTATKSLKKEIREGNDACFDTASAEMLLSLGKGMGEEKGCMFVRAPESVGHYIAYLIFPKNARQVENAEILKALLSQALAFFALEESCLHCLLKEKKHDETDRH